MRGAREEMPQPDGAGYFARAVMIALRVGRSASRSPLVPSSVVSLLAGGMVAASLAVSVAAHLNWDRPPHVVAPEAVWLPYFAVGDSTGTTISTGVVAFGLLDALRRDTAGFAGVGAYLQQVIALGEMQHRQDVQGVLASGDYWTTLGTRPLLGRFFSRAESAPQSGSRVIVLSHRFWSSALGRDTTIVGRTILVGGLPYTIIGVAPPGFRGTGQRAIDVFLPLYARTAESPANAGWQDRGYEIRLVLRLRNGVSRSRAQELLVRTYLAVLRERGETPARLSARLVPARGSIHPETGLPTAEARLSLWLMAVAVILMLLACTNSGVLLVLRSLQRQSETAVKRALGLTVASLRLELILESLMLAASAAVVALLVNRWGAARLTSASTFDAYVDGLGTDWKALGIIVACGMLCTPACAALPVARVPADSMPILNRQRCHGRTTRTDPNRLVLLFQIVVSTVLLFGAALFVQSLRHARGVDLGLRPKNVWVVHAEWQPGQASLAAALSYYERALARARELPMVSEAALSTATPLTQAIAGAFRVPGSEPLPRDPILGAYSVTAVTEGYFRTLGMRIIEGRVFDPADATGPPVLIVNETIAHAAWPGASAIGRCVDIGGAQCATVIGVVNDARRFSLREPPTFHYFVPLGSTRHPRPVLLLRLRDDASTDIGGVQSILRRMDPAGPILDVHSVESDLDWQLRPWYLGAFILVGAGAAATALACFGMFASVSYRVSACARELALRMALGATAGRIARLVLGDGMRLAVAGISIGSAIVLTLAPRLTPLLFEQPPRDLRLLALTDCLLLGVVISALARPILCAARQTPMKSLRSG